MYIAGTPDLDRRSNLAYKHPGQAASSPRQEGLPRAIHAQTPAAGHVERRVWEMAVTNSRCVLIAILLAASCGAAHAQLRPEDDAVAAAPGPLLTRLRSDAYAYFRFVNRPWIERVCTVFAEEIRSMPKVRLHGDAHVEQFALTRDAWGLDDFDDSAFGPALVDIVRFLGSVELVARQRGWTDRRDALFDRFFDGYRRGVSQPDYRPPRPSIVPQLQTVAFPPREVFLTWGEAKMEEMSGPVLTDIARALTVFGEQLQKDRPDLPPGYLGLVRAGWLHMGIGSANTPKFLLRVQGPSSSPSDDELLEGKRTGDLSGLPCLDVVTLASTSRIILGARNIGRLKHNIMVAGPDLPLPALGGDASTLRHWFIRSWDPTYREVTVADLRSSKDLSDIVYDAGVQLGQGSLREQEGASIDGPRRQTLEMLGKFEQKIRAETRALVDDLMLGWQQLAAGKPKD